MSPRTTAAGGGPCPDGGPAGAGAGPGGGPGGELHRHPPRPRHPAPLPHRPGLSAGRRGGDGLPGEHGGAGPRPLLRRGTDRPRRPRPGGDPRPPDLEGAAAGEAPRQGGQAHLPGGERRQLRHGPQPPGPEGAADQRRARLHGAARPQQRRPPDPGRLRPGVQEGPARKPRHPGGRRRQAGRRQIHRRLLLRQAGAAPAPPGADGGRVAGLPVHPPRSSASGTCGPISPSSS